MINAEQIDPFLLPMVALEQRDQLPNDGGIYFAILDTEILYVGKAVNLQQRWQSHHRTNQLKSLGKVIIAWFSIADLEKQNLDKLEKTCIEHFSPRLNDLNVPKEFSLNPRTVQMNARFSERTHEQIQELIKSTGYTQVQLMIVAIDRMFQKERQIFMKRTTNPQEATQAVQEDKIVKMPLGGRNWHVNGISEGANGWVAKISHPDYENSRIEDIADSQEFVIYSQAQYRRMVDELAGRLVHQE